MAAPITASGGCRPSLTRTPGPYWEAIAALIRAFEHISYVKSARRNRFLNLRDPCGPCLIKVRCLRSLRGSSAAQRPPCDTIAHSHSYRSSKTHSLSSAIRRLFLREQQSAKRMR